MNSENRTYWTAWFLEKARVRVRLTSGARTWDFAPSELRAQWVLRGEIWGRLEEAVASKAHDGTIDVALDPEDAARRDDELDISAERRRTLGALDSHLYGLIARFLSDHDGWDEPPSEEPDARQWGREMAERFPTSLRDLLSMPRGAELLGERVIFVERTDDIGSSIPDVLHDAGKEALFESVKETLGTLDTRACEAFVERFPGHPLLLTDWANSRWSDATERDRLQAWLSFLAGLGLEPTIWTKLGTDTESLGVFAATEARRIELATKHRAAVAGALGDADFRHELDGWITHQAPPADANDDDDWPTERRETRASITLRKLFETLERPELETPGLRDADRRVLLQALPDTSREEAAPLVSLLQTAFWQSLAPDDIELWLKLSGFGVLFYRPTETAWLYLVGADVVDFWRRVAASDRTHEAKTALFQLALRIARAHDCVLFDELSDLLARFERDARPELLACGAEE